VLFKESSNLAARLSAAGGEVNYYFDVLNYGVDVVNGIEKINIESVEMAKITKIYA
jgi:hypothetical protein